MSHRAEQILDAASAAITAGEFRGTVFKHRAQSLSQKDGELPAVSVDFGDDPPLDDSGADNFAFLDSLLGIETTIYLKDDEEQKVRTALLNARTAIHKALMADRTLGLSFVIDTRYGGAERPLVVADSEFVTGQLICRWRVHYRMNITDPS